MSTLMSDDFILDAEQYDEFKMWQGLIGPYYYPFVDNIGNLSWTNNGDLHRPARVRAGTATRRCGRLRRAAAAHMVSGGAGVDRARRVA